MRGGTIGVVLPVDLGRGPFRGRDAVAAGRLTPKQLRSPRWRREFAGIYVDARTPPSPLLRIRAAALLLPLGAVITGRSAAVLWGVTRFADVDDPVEIAAPRWVTSRAGIEVRTGPVDPSEVAVRWEVPVHTPAHVAYAIARDRPLLDAVGWVDALMRVRGLRAVDLARHVSMHRSQRGCQIAAETLRWCDRRAESPPESRLRVTIAQAGIGPLIPQYNVLDSHGSFIARVDLAIPDCKLAIEYDGQWHADAAQLTRDRHRQRALTAAGWEIFHVTAPDMHTPAPFLRALKARINARRPRS